MPADSSSSDRPHWAIAIRVRRQALGLSQELLAERSQASQSWISQIERGSQNPAISSAERLGRLIRALQWGPKEFAAATGLTASHVDENRGEHSADGDIALGELVSVRDFGTVTAGTQESFRHNDWEYLELPSFFLDGYKPEDCFTLTVVGNSMMCDDVRNRIPEGAIAIFHQHLEPTPEDIVAAWLDTAELGEVRVLKIHRPAAGYLTLHSWNETIRPIIVNADDDFQIMGVYLGSWNPSSRLRHAAQTRNHLARVQKDLERVKSNND